jgi:membrane protease YdiL (CAAX protease family)
VWGTVLGLIIATPLLLVGGNVLSRTVHLMFQMGSGANVRTLPPGAVLAYLVFVMPLAESLFFRGYMQQNRSVWLVAILSSVWSLFLFLPMLEVASYPLVAVIIAIVLTVINLIYSYVRERNGLAAAWACQIVINFVLLFLAYLSP